MRLSLKEQPIIAGIITSLIMVGAGAVLNYLKLWHPGWFSVVLWGLVGSALMAVILMPIILLRRLPKPPPEITPENIETYIRTWLDAFQLAVRRVDASAEAFFALIATPINGLPVAISRPRAWDRYILIESSISMSPDDKTFYDGLDEETKGIFGAKLSVELAQSPVSFGMDLPQGSITLHRRVPITRELTEGSFMQAFEEHGQARLRALRTLQLMLLDARKKLEAAQLAR